MQRIAAAQYHYKLDFTSNNEFVVPVVGDLSLSRFGLSESNFDLLGMFHLGCFYRFSSLFPFHLLGRSVDAIYHCGAHVNVLLPYSALRSVNVMSTLEVIRLAVRNHAVFLTLHLCIRANI
jgi:thioester reductase-like protein